MFDVQRSVLSRVYAGLNRFRPWQATAFENVRSRGTGPCFSYRSQAPEVYFNYAKIYFLGNGKLAVQRVYFLEKDTRIYDRLQVRVITYCKYTVEGRGKFTNCLSSRKYETFGSTLIPFCG
ncbi:uncharacterized protein LOC143153192 [Ptiloglossa arizonensis]|uniref:uncharacterized protein LOC143153192 n=1 Tax=Ptiloglossa arizonensis TaxID=3350558 RepID=UPI003F9F11CC